MKELLDEAAKAVRSLEDALERERLACGFAVSDKADRFYTMLLLQVRLDCWRGWLRKLESYSRRRSVPVERRSAELAKRIESEKRTVPGFVTEETLQQLLEHIRRLEGQLESGQIGLQERHGAG
ncbi:hypothetical protein [Paenibacillus ginsengihumi]|uniref:hypothetical protein n=1 Tax=Paenibacillus ginsengihumi TaxID=431596 RepID=UPI0003691FF1|nr:hypothetical protein [Paenibacillus ginsengihumi]